MEIEEIFEKFNIKINLFDGDILEINFEDEFFDCITCISVLDHVKEYDKAINEIYRVLKHSGILIVGLVVKNSITDLGFSILNAKTDIYHVATYKEIFKEINKKFKEEYRYIFPKFLPIKFSLYVCAVFIKV
jgi:ubiquinone/menaquinone biosynthesis C-methylase UbiE